MNRQVRLAAWPVGVPKPSDWEHTTEPVGEPGDGDLLVRNHYLSLDRPRPARTSPSLARPSLPKRSRQARTVVGDNSRSSAMWLLAIPSAASISALARCT
jgi:NADPH-dependent curcumin reductase CurA